MKRDIMMIGGMGAALGLLAASAHADYDVLVEHGEAVTKPKRRVTQMRPLDDPRRERKEKSASLSRMLGRKGRA